MTTKQAEELRLAVRRLSSRGLYIAAKWSAELLVAINTNLEEGKNELPRSVHVRPEPVSDMASLAKAYFDVRDYRRAAHCLQQCENNLEVFLRGYATFLAGERLKEEAMQEATNTLGKNAVVNKDLTALDQELSKKYSEKSLDGHLLFLYGCVVRELGQPDRAREIFAESVSTFPCNWSAWRSITELVNDKDQLATLVPKLPDNHWMYEFFLADLHLDLQDAHEPESAKVLEVLSNRYPESAHVTAQIAQAQYQRMNYDDAENLFNDLLTMDPYRLENMDTYSNILYVKERKGALSFLAHRAVKNDKYRPETCCICGNYYSLKGEHEKAVEYFRRALKLQPSYLSAWTLMGHEYVEMRDTPAAIECYRKAVDINPRDYRAWYGLGQTYEILDMHSYALYYFRKATHLKTYDPRMWCAMGASYERLGRIENAIKCYERAEGNQDREGIAVNKLGRLCERLGDRSRAAYYFERLVKRRDATVQSGDTTATLDADTMNALLFLGRYYRDARMLAKAEECLQRLLDCGGAEKESAKRILTEIRQHRKAEGNQTIDTPTAPHRDLAAVDANDLDVSMEIDDT